MTEYDKDFLQHEVLNAHEWRGVTQLANALSIFEPLAKRGNLGMTIANRLVSLRLAEKGPTSERYASIGLPEGYRLTDLGWKIKERGRFPNLRSAR